jgi:hypothetical protein
MLIVKVFVNNKQIDQINIHNVGTQDPKTGEHYYEVVDKMDYPVIPDLVRHQRNSGYRKLLVKVLKLLDKHKVKESK